MKLRSFLFGGALLCATAVLATAGLAALGWKALAARDDEWSRPIAFTVAGHRFERDAGMAVLLRTATHPLAARVVDGRSFTTAQGRWTLRTGGDGRLQAECAPCRFTLAALGPNPVTVERATLMVQAEGGDRYRGSLRLAGAGRALALDGRARFDRGGHLVVDARLPATPMADVVQVFGGDLPERDRVRVDGSLSLAISARSERGPWKIDPRVEGFAVSGLDSERFADLQRPLACRVDARAELPTVTGWLPRAVIAAEDARFFEHPGYDLRAMVDALQHNQRDGAPLTGASTITQQLAKLLVAGDERSATRKLRELLYAVEMERTLGKARILQLYLALAPWGQGVCGAERAARVHLGQRDPSTLGPVASAWLASLLTAPDGHLAAETAAGEVDQARVERVLLAMRGLGSERREKARLQLLFWSPPALARRPSAPTPSPVVVAEPPAAAPEAPAESPAVAPSP